MAFIIKHNSAAPTLKSARSLVDDVKGFTYTIIYNLKIENAGGASLVTINDISQEVQTSPTIYNEPQILITSNDFIDAPSFESTNENILTVDSAGRVSRVSDGDAEVLISVGGYTKNLKVSVASSTPTSQVVGAEFAEGSLGKQASDNIDTLLVGKTMEDNGLIFTSQNHSTDTFVRNTDVWCYGADLTCISPSNSNSNNRKAGTLLTPRHVAVASHYEYPVGTKVYFVSQDGNNTVYERTVLSKVRHPEYTPYFPDITICCLDSDLPPNIKPCKVLPANYSDYLIETALGRPPSLSLDQEEKALVTDLYRLNNEMASFAAPNQPNRLEFYESKVAGDSGNPSFLVLDLGSGLELILLTLWTFGGAGAGTFVTPQISDMNAMIATSDTQAGNGGTGYTLTEADLSGFTSFV